MYQLRRLGRGDVAEHEDVWAAAQYPAELASIAEARSFVEDECRDVLPEEATETAVLLTSELVTNAVVHAHSPVAVEVSTPESVVRVAVGDDSEEPPVMAEADARDDHGRGLRWVDEMSHEWGVVHRDPGKTVWFTVNRDDEATP
jgi:anti-sigma regulatory factor (Ser/Thr protein kinase)